MIEFISQKNDDIEKLCFFKKKTLSFQASNPNGTKTVLRPVPSNFKDGTKIKFINTQNKPNFYNTETVFEANIVDYFNQKAIEINTQYIGAAGVPSVFLFEEVDLGCVEIVEEEIFENLEFDWETVGNTSTIVVNPQTITIDTNILEIGKMYRVLNATQNEINEVTTRATLLNVLTVEDDQITFTPSTLFNENIIIEKYTMKSQSVKTKISFFKYVSLSVLLLLNFFSYSQISLNDNLGSHANTVRNYIELNNISKIEETLFSQGITLNNDSILISCNAYIGSSFLKEKIYYQPDRIHCFAGMNNINQVNATYANFDKNVLTIISSDNNNLINDSIQTKFDIAVNSCNINSNCATSYAAGYTVGLIDKYFINKNKKSNGAAIKASVLNSRNNYILDTSLLKKQEFITDTIFKNEIHNYNISLDNFCDSIRVTLFYYDRPSLNNFLVDTLLFNNQKVTSNTIQKTLYNTSNINLNLDSYLCDSFYYKYDYNNIYDTINDTVRIIIINDTTAVLLTAKDSIRGYYESNNSYESEIFFGRRWQTGDTINIRYYHNINLNDTVTLFKISYNYIKTDTVVTRFTNSIIYAIAYVEFTSIINVPVKLVSFNASVENQKVVLNFETETELNNSHFCIERTSNNNFDFETIGIVNGNGTTIKNHHYKFIDDLPNQINYYRLKQVNYNGSFEYSKIIVANNIKIQKGFIEINGTAKIYNNLGQLVKTGTNIIYTSDLKNGVYHIFLNNRINTLLIIN